MILIPEMEEPFLLEILRAGLEDRSAKVRGWAVDNARSLADRWGGGGLSDEDIIPDLKRALAKERHAETKEELEGTLSLLCDGYRLTLFAEGRYLLWIRYLDEDGRYASAHGRTSDSEIKEKGIEKVIEEAIEETIEETKNPQY